MNVYHKYSRTYHFSDSPNLQNDDRRHENESIFNGKEVVSTLKLDGESCSMYSNYIHARSIDSKNHPSRNWVKAYHGQIKHLIRDGYRFCGENLYATHSIHYTQLESYFYLFNIWNEKNVALSWDSTKEIAWDIGMTVVPEIYRGVYDRQLVHKAFEDYCSKSVDPVEGYVMRVVDEIPYEEWTLKAIKYVRRGHVQTSEHWMSQKIVPNELKV